MEFYFFKYFISDTNYIVFQVKLNGKISSMRKLTVQSVLCGVDNSMYAVTVPLVRFKWTFPILIHLFLPCIYFFSCFLFLSSFFARFLCIFHTNLCLFLCLYVPFDSTQNFRNFSKIVIFFSIQNWILYKDFFFFLQFLQSSVYILSFLLFFISFYHFSQLVL